jgi:membrane protein implicated in regulation of membrane protease activity
MRTGRPSGQPVGRNPDVHADVGERVQVDQWDAQGRARVQYRGTQWDAQWDPVDRALYDATPETDRPAASEFVIRALDGNSLILARRLPDTPRP